MNILLEQADERILNYVLNEVKAADCRLGDVLSASIRSLSNLATLGRNVNGPVGIKKYNPLQWLGLC